MRPFAYARPDSLKQVIALLAEHGNEARLLAGGTDVLVRLRSGRMRPSVLVDLKQVASLSAAVVETAGVLRVGARVVMASLTADARVRRHFPALAESARVVGSVQIRNRATLAGNICNASPAADTSPALLVYGSLVNAIGPAGRRTIPLARFFAGPGRTTLQPGELVESIDLPIPRQSIGSAFGRVTRRWGVDLATVNLACAVTDGGVTRLAYGAVAPTPVFLEDDTGTLASGHDLAASSKLLERMIAATSPISDLRGARDYRLAMLAVMSRRTLETSIDRLRAGAA